MVTYKNFGDDLLDKLNKNSFQGLPKRVWWIKKLDKKK